MVDKLLHRALKAASSLHEGFDAATLGKPGYTTSHSLSAPLLPRSRLLPYPFLSAASSFQSAITRQPLAGHSLFGFIPKPIAPLPQRLECSRAHPLFGMGAVPGLTAKVFAETVAPTLGA